LPAQPKANTNPSHAWISSAARSRRPWLRPQENVLDRCNRLQQRAARRYPRYFSRGLDWQFAGVASVHGGGASDLVLRNVKAGFLEVYDIANNQLTGAATLGRVGLDWELGGFAADPPTGSMFGRSFGGGSGAADGLNAVPLGADMSQQTFLTTPQHSA